MDGGGTGSGNEVVVKKNRGKRRPSKYGPLPSPSVASPNQSTPTPQQKRGNPIGSGSMQWVSDVGKFMFFSSYMCFKLT